MMTTATKVRERPILFRGEMIRAILNTKIGTWPAQSINAALPLKWQTRRIIKGLTIRDRGIIIGLTGPDTDKILFDEESGEWYCEGGLWHARCPYGVVGDHLWTRESMYENEAGEWRFRADDEPVGCDRADDAAMIVWTHHKQTSHCASIFMPRWASRITHEVMSVSVQRIQSITDEDAEAEGIGAWAAAYCPRDPQDELYPRAYFQLAWDSMHGKPGYSFESNRFVWVIAFRRLT